jgi:hypothetical protein
MKPVQSTNIPSGFIAPGLFNVNKTSDELTPHPSSPITWIHVAMISTSAIEKTYFRLHDAVHPYVKLVLAALSYGVDSAFKGIRASFYTESNYEARGGEFLFTDSSGCDNLGVMALLRRKVD